MTSEVAAQLPTAIRSTVPGVDPASSPPSSGGMSVPTTLPSGSVARQRSPSVTTTVAVRSDPARLGMPAQVVAGRRQRPGDLPGAAHDRRQPAARRPSSPVRATTAPATKTTVAA